VAVLRGLRVRDPARTDLVRGSARRRDCQYRSGPERPIIFPTLRSRDGDTLYMIPRPPTHSRAVPVAPVFPTWEKKRNSWARAVDTRFDRGRPVLVFVIPAAPYGDGTQLCSSTRTRSPGLTPHPANLFDDVRNSRSRCDLPAQRQAVPAESGLQQELRLAYAQ
jgi:hypothetical protein